MKKLLNRIRQWWADFKAANRARAIARAVEKERGSGILDSQIYLDQDKRLVSPSNPEGLLVANTRDEPRGGWQGVDRERATGGAVGGEIPNFRAPPLWPPGGGGPNPTVWAQVVAAVKQYSAALGTSAVALAKNVFGAKAVDSALLKATAAGKTLKVIFADMLSPLGLAAGLAVGFTLSLYKMVRGSQLVADSLKEFANAQIYQGQFTALLGDADKANDRLGQLANFASSGAFAFDDVVDANRRLQILTRGALVGKSAMKQLADSAAASGTSMTQMAAIVGGVWEDAFSTGNVQTGVQQLRDVGAVSAAAAAKLVLLNQAGMRGSQMWSAISQELNKNKGAADALKNTISGLTTQLDNVKGEQLAGIGEMFAAGEADGIRTAITVWRELGPVLKEILAPFAAVSNAIAKAVLEFTKLVTSSSAIKAALVAVSQAVLFVVTALALLGAGQAIRALFALLGPLLKIGKAFLTAGAAGTGFAAVMGRVAATFLRFLGPIGAAITLISILGETLIAAARKFAPLEAAMQKLGMLSNESAEATKATQDIGKEVQDLSTSGGTAAEKKELIEKAEANLQKAKERRKAAEEKQKGAGAGGYLGNAAAGALAGAAAGAGFLGIGAIPGAVIGAGVGVAATAANDYFAADDREKAAQEARQQEEEAKKARDQARQVRPKPPAGFLNTPVYQRAEAEANATLAEADKMQDKLDQKIAEMERASPDGKLTESQQEEVDREQQAIDAKRGEAAARVSPERLEKDFEREMTAIGSQAKMARAIADATGNPEMKRRAQALEEQEFVGRRSKELRDQGFDENQAQNMAKGEYLTQRLQEEQAKYSTFASATGRVGGAAGEAGATGSSEEARILKEIARILESDPGQPAADIPRNMANAQR